jgi:L-threonylcarbamoyladenylate synthase
MKIVPFKSPTKDVYNEAVKVLNNGGLVIFPTETCYGMGAEATNEASVQKLLVYKGGRENKAISIAVADKTMAEKYVETNETAHNLYSTLLPGPVTVISKSRGKVVKQLESDMGTLGIRIPAYPPICKLIKQLDKPITATSANSSGQKPPYSLDEWQKYTSNAKQQMVALFLDAGKLPLHPPSTLVDTTLNDLTVLRQGEVEIPKAAKLFGSFSDGETQRLGEQLIRSVLPNKTNKPLIVAIQGELGAGKTQMAKGIAKGLSIKDNVPSPTYTIIREYQYKLNQRSGILYHIDTWRLHDAKELRDLGLAQMLKPGNVMVIEWVQKMKEELTKLNNQAIIVWVDIKQISETGRTITWWLNT